MSKVTQLIAPGIILDKRRIDGNGMAMSGAVEAFVMMLSFMQECYTRTIDANERKVISIFIEFLEEHVEDLSRELQIHAQNIGAIRAANGLERVQ